MQRLLARRDGVSVPRLAAIAFVAVAGVLALLALAGRLLLSPDSVETRLDDALDEATAGLYGLSIRELDLQPLRGRVVARDVRIQPDTAELGRLEREGEAPAAHATLRVEVMELRGVDRWRLLRERNLVARDLRAAGWDLALTLSAEDTTAASAGAEPGERTLMERLAAGLPERKAAVRLERVSLRGGRVRREGRGAGVRSEASGVVIEAADLTLHARAADDTARILFADRLDVTVETFRHLSGDSLYALAGGAVRLSSDGAIVEIDSLRFAATLEPAAFQRRIPHRMTRYDIGMSDIVLAGLDSRSLMHGTGLRVSSLTVAALDADILLDKRRPEGPAGRVLLPNDAMRRLDRVLSIDTLRLLTGRIDYAEVATDGVRPGRLSFAEIQVELRNLSNDSARMSHDSPASLEGRATVAGQGPLEVSLEMPLLSPSLDLAFRGRMGPLHAPALNTMFENLDGISIRSGEVRQIRFDATTRAGTTSGTLTAVYDDLAVDRIDKEDGGQSVGKWLESFIANTFIVRGSNLPEEGELPNRGTISHTRASDEAFLAFIWASLRSGILSQIGID